MSSDEDGAALMAAFKKNGAGGRPSIQSKAKRVSLPPRLASEPSTIAESEDAMEDAAPPTPRRAVGVIIPIKHIKKNDYTYYEPTDEVEEVLREYSKRGDMMYEVRSSESGIKQVSEKMRVHTQSQ